jgi:8-oxo-dGTP pyrophosphatase MutT (NUDIX family)
VAALRHARATSAGGVVHRTVGDLTQIAVVHRRNPPLWALPKGTPDRGETLEETAVRETREETGLEVEIEGPIRAISYFFVRDRTRYHKTVHFFLMRAVGGDLEAHDAEFDEAHWVQLEEATALLTYPTERQVVHQAAGMLGADADAGEASDTAAGATA